MRAALLAAVITCGLTAGAQANVVAYETPFTVFANSFNSIIHLQPFNPALGTVLGIDVRVFGKFNLPGYFITPLSGLPPATVPLTSKLTAFPLQPTSSFLIATQPSVPVINRVATGIANFGFDISGSIPLRYADDPILNLSPVTLVGGLNIDVAATGDFDPSSLVGTARVTFTYSAVPEPASLAVFGAGVAALGLVRRRPSKGQASA